MRRLVIAAVIALSSAGVFASIEGATTENAASSIVVDASVTITPIPAPAPVTELLKEIAPTPQMRPTKKLKVAKKKSIPKSMLSRTERHQMALLAASPKAGTPSLLDFFNDEDAQYAGEVLDLHRSFSRPKVIKAADADDEGDDDETALSESVKLRLFLARMKAVAAHEKKFS